MKTMLKFLVLAVAAMAMGAMAETDATVKVTKFHQSYPYSGKATVEYTVATSATLPANAVAEITISTDDASATFKQKGVMAGANTNVIDFASSFGGALVLTNASFVVTIAEADLGGVQLWENGPYWAECNVGATTPEEYGYYFWWGDTVGYTRSGGAWRDHSMLPGYTNVTWVSSTGEPMSSTPFSSSTCPTCGKDNLALLTEGYIDSTGNLVAAHDAATAHLGAPWRMPTKAEIDDLVSNCAADPITTNGVSGILVTGRGDYADRSIFLPVSGRGSNSSLTAPGLNGYYWSSSPYPDNSEYACQLNYDTHVLRSSNNPRNSGMPVRPVRGFAE